MKILLIVVRFSDFFFHNFAACEKTVADIVFLIDESGSVGFKNFLKIKQFVIDVVASLKIGENNVRVGVVTFSSYTFIKFHLNKYFDKQRMINAINNIGYFGGNTNTHKALRILRYTAFTKRNGDRIGVPNIAIVVTDGISSNVRATIKEAVALQKSGVVIFSIGIGKYLQQYELIVMASKPKSEHKLSADSFVALQYIREDLTKKLCEGMYMCVLWRIIYGLMNMKLRFRLATISLNFKRIRLVLTNLIIHIINDVYLYFSSLWCTIITWHY